MEFLATEKPVMPLRALYGAVWVILTYYAFNLAPGAGSEAAAIDLELAIKMITTPLMELDLLSLLPSLTRWVCCRQSIVLFYCLVARKDPSNSSLFSYVRGGFFAIGPYLALRNYVTEGYEMKRGVGVGPSRPS